MTDASQAPQITEVKLEGVSFKLSDADQPARFVLGLRKSGSTLLNKIMHFIAKRNDLHTVDLAGTFFQSGMKVTDWQDKDLSEVIRPGNMYLGFRALPKAMEGLEVFQTSRRIFMFRDPRDALVSQYFSDAYSHSLPSAKTEAGKAGTQDFLAKREKALATDINDYVLQHAPNMDRTFMAYAEVLASPLTLPLRYEEYIFTKKRLIHNIVDHFGLKINKGAVETLMGQVDIVPGSEDAKKFVRNVVPGDHRRKLTPETIDKLDRKLQNSLRAYNYY